MRKNTRQPLFCRRLVRPFDKFGHRQGPTLAYQIEQCIVRFVEELLSVIVDVWSILKKSNAQFSFITSLKRCDNQKCLYHFLQKIRLLMFEKVTMRQYMQDLCVSA